MFRMRFREVLTAVAALVICIACVTLGTWIFLRLSGAGDEFRALQGASASMPSPGPSAANRTIDPEAMMERWSLPVMLGILGGAALCTGLWAGAVSRSKPAVIAIVGIIPVYVISFATGLRWPNLIWAGLYTVIPVVTASAIGRVRRV